MTYRETIDYLFGIRLFGQKLGLEVMQELLRRMGEPQRGLKFIHIAGTNGKGSVAAMCHSVLTAAGYRTGLYTSPHLVSFCERFQINGQPIAPADVVRLVEKIRPVLEQVEFREPTFFEVVTAMALEYFREQGVEIAVWETGLGGRLDATNVVIPLVSVITSLGIEHTQHLGNTLADIAREKCGIIKPAVPVVTAPQDADALAVIRQTCAERACPLTVVQPPWPDYDLPLIGAHQKINCAIAIAALRAVGSESRTGILPVFPAKTDGRQARRLSYFISDEQLREGLRRTHWPGRFHVVGNVALDGAHNPPAARLLATTLRERYPGVPLLLIIGVLNDKDYRQMSEILAPLAARVICVPVKSERTCDPRELAQQFPEATICADVAEALALRRADEMAVVTGSLFLVGEALRELGVLPAETERELVLQ